MPGVTGISYVCDRCGKSHFVPMVKNRWDNVKIPKSWMKVEDKYICPTCAVPFRRFATWFFDEDAIPEAWRERE